MIKADYQKLSVPLPMEKLPLVYCILLILLFTVFEEQCLAQMFCKLPCKK